MAGKPLRLKGREESGPGTDNSSYTAGTPVYGLQEMSGTEVYNGIIYKMLKEFAKSNGLTGELTLLDTVANSPTSSVGDFVDTTRSLEVGARGTAFELSGIVENTRSIYQVLTSVSGSIVRPVCYRNGSLEEMSDTDIFNEIVSPALDYMTNRGIGSYHFSSASGLGGNVPWAEGSALSGTWVRVFDVTDYYKSGNISNTSIQTYVDQNGGNPTTSINSYTRAANSVVSTTTSTLWRKTDDTVPSSQPRPLKFANTSDRGKHLVEMTNEEILKLLIPFRNAIITDGRGRYRFTATAPSGGTWSKRGDRIVDLLNTIGTGYYASGYTLTYTGAYTGYYTSVYTGYFTRTSTTTRTDYFSDGGISGLLGGGGSPRSYTRTFTSAIEKYFSRPESSVVNKNYARIVTVAYTTPIVSAVTLVNNDDYLWVKRSNV